MRLLIQFCMAFLVAGMVWADATTNQGVFTSVSGNVQVLRLNQQVVQAQKDLTVFEGEKVATGDNASAVLRLFDGSEMTISPKTQFTLAALQKPSEDDKVIKFQLIIGKLLAVVKKLTTAHSTFEIEAGGVVCGVRGTQFSMNCSGGSKPQVVVEVIEGSVYTIDGHGNHFICKPGPVMTFLNGSKIENTNTNNSPVNGVKSAPATNSSNSTSSSTTNNTNGSTTTSSNNNSGTNNSTGSTSTSSDNSSSTNNGNGSSNNSSTTSSSDNTNSTTSSTTQSNNSLTDLNNQFQTTTHVNSNNTLNSPSVQAAEQFNVIPRIGH